MKKIFFKNLVIINFVLPLFGLFNSYSQTPSLNIQELANLLIEIDDFKVKKGLKNKINEYYKNPTTVFEEEDYFFDTKNSEYQAHRGSSKEIKDKIEWFLLIDYLGFNKYIWELDWKFNDNEVRSIINHLAKNKKYKIGVLPKISSKYDLHAGSRLAFYASKLNEIGFTLVNLDINSDSFITALIKKSNLDSIIESAEKDGYLIREYKISTIDKI